MYNESEYKGKEVTLNKPSSGDVKKYKVFVKDPSTGNVKKVNFGDPNMEIKRDNPERRKNFRARHNCSTATDKTTPRYWSCKFWSKNSVSDLLKEVIEPENVDVNFIEIHDELSPLIWDENDTLKPDVRRSLLSSVKHFIEFCEISNVKYVDIILTGSMANYNYTEDSDIDVHILMNFDQISSNIEFVSNFFKTKKDLWSENIPIQIKGHDVELYFQNSEETHHSSGIYSLMKNSWITKPTKKIINVDMASVQLKSAHFMNLIDKLESYESDNWINKYDSIKTKIKKYRQSGLKTNGEFSIENLVFKVLRNSGYLDKLVNMKNNYLSNKLSIDEFES